MADDQTHTSARGEEGEDVRLAVTFIIVSRTI